MSMLESLKSLSSLNMAYTNITNQGVRCLCNLTQLTFLSIDSRLITDAGLSFISRLAGLEALDLYGCKVCACCCLPCELQQELL
jgi:internalin A